MAAPLSAPKVTTYNIQNPAPKHVIEAAAHVSALAMREESMDEYRYPRRRKYPEAYRKAIQRDITTWLEHPYSVLAIATLGSDVVGFALWQREGRNDRDQKVWGKDDGGPLRKLRGWLVYTKFWDCILAALNPAASFWHEVRFGGGDDVPYDRSFREPDDYVHLYDIGVDPTYGRRGIGRTLMDWGMETAMAEGIPVTLTSVPSAQPFYEKLNFGAYGEWRWAKGKDTSGRERKNICMVWRP